MNSTVTPRFGMAYIAKRRQPSLNQQVGWSVPNTLWGHLTQPRLQLTTTQTTKTIKGHEEPLTGLQHSYMKLEWRLSSRPPFLTRIPKRQLEVFSPDNSSIDIIPPDRNEYLKNKALARRLKADREVSADLFDFRRHQASISKPSQTSVSFDIKKPRDTQ